jgi:hypothetical protein
LKHEETIIYESCHNNLDVIDKIVPDIFSESELIGLVRYIKQSRKDDGKVSFASVRTKILQDKKQEFKDTLLNRLHKIEHGVYGFTDDTIDAVVTSYKTRQIDYQFQTYSNIKKDSTYADIEKLADNIKIINGYGMVIDDIENAEQVKTDLLEKPTESLTDERLYLPKLNETATFLRGLFGDYFRPRLYVLGGYPSMGKNIVLNNLISLLIKQNYRGVYFNWDNTSSEETSSILSIETGIPYETIEDKRYDNKELQSIKKVSLDLIDFSPKVKNWKEIRRVLETGKYKWFAIDYFDKIKLSGKKSKTEGLEESVSEIQNMCREFNITALVLSQLNKEGGMKWSSSLFESSFYALKIDGERGTTTRKISNHKFKRGIPGDYTMKFRGDTCQIISIQEGYDNDM